MENKLERLKRKRSTLRSSITKLIKVIEDKLKCKVEENMIKELRESYDLLNEKKNNMRSLDEEVQELIDINLIEEDCNLSEEYNDKCIIACSQINQFLNGITAVPPARNPQNSFINQPSGNGCKFQF